jgi:hypothetical protein
MKLSGRRLYINAIAWIGLARSGRLGSKVSIGVKFAGVAGCVSIRSSAATWVNLGNRPVARVRFDNTAGIQAGARTRWRYVNSCQRARCGIPLPRTFWHQVLTSGQFSSCWAQNPLDNLIYTLHVLGFARTVKSPPDSL